jgi:hypothetical protein
VARRRAPLGQEGKDAIDAFGVTVASHRPDLIVLADVHSRSQALERR